MYDFLGKTVVGWYEGRGHSNQEAKDREGMLAILIHELYGCNIDAMQTDLRTRKETKPWLIQINARIEEDLAALDVLKKTAGGYGENPVEVVREYVGYRMQ
jgi:hypothetical protein